VTRWLALAAALACAACKLDDGGDDVVTPTHGHDGLMGAAWSGPLDSAGAIAKTLGLTFESSRVTVVNTCQKGDRTLTAAVEVPVDYAYAVIVDRAAAAGSVACGITLDAGRYDLLIVGSRLRVVAGGDVFDLAPTSATDGLFGTWSAPTVDSGVLAWTFADGALRIQRVCPAISSEPVTLTVATDTRAYIDFLDEARDTETDGDFECSVVSLERRVEYTLDDDTLTLSDDGDTITLTR